jgi:hypothetical protein
MLGTRSIVNIPAGVNKEDNSFTSLIYTDANRIRFYQGLPETIGGWISLKYGNDQTLTGVIRNIYSYFDNNNVEHIIIGTNTRLYTYEGGNLYNITPLVPVGSAVAIPNSLTTNYSGFVALNPITTAIGSSVVTFNFGQFNPLIFHVGDVIQISGVSTSIGGIAAAVFNQVVGYTINSVNAATTSFTFNIFPSIASSTQTAGIGCNLATRVLTVAQVAHGFLDGDRIKISLSTGIGTGLIAADINIESTVRFLSANTYYYYMNQTTDFPDGVYVNAGGAATIVQGQIAGGQCSLTYNKGFGAGNYGSGAYSIGLSMDQGYTQPRIWSLGIYNGTLILTPGQQGAVYQWSNSINVAPVILTNAPSAVNYVFIAQAENTIVTFGAPISAALSGNNISSSDNQSITVWTPNGATNTAFQSTIAGAIQLIASAYVKGQYLLFTLNAVYIMIYVGKPDIWNIRLLTEADGIIGPNAVMEIPDGIVWMGQNDFYIYNGSVVSQIPNNTLLHWMLDNINSPLAYLSFARKVIEYNEVWWFFPIGNEPDNYVIWNYQEGHWTNGQLGRTAAEIPNNPIREQYMANGSCDGSVPTQLYIHEVYNDYTDDGFPMGASLTTNYSEIGAGDFIQQISSIIPSNILLPLGSSNYGQFLYSMTVNTKEYDGDNPRVFGPYQIFANTTKIDTRIVGRQRQYVYTFLDNGTPIINLGIRIQKIYEMLKPFTVR